MGSRAEPWKLQKYHTGRSRQVHIYDVVKTNQNRCCLSYYNDDWYTADATDATASAAIVTPTATTTTTPAAAATTTATAAATAATTTATTTTTTTTTTRTTTTTKTTTTTTTSTPTTTKGLGLIQPVCVGPFLCDDVFLASTRCAFLGCEHWLHIGAPRCQAAWVPNPTAGHHAGFIFWICLSC